MSVTQIKGTQVLDASIGIVDLSATGTPSSSTFLRGDNTWTAPALGNLTGLATGIATFLATPSSTNLISAITDEIGTGKLVFNDSPTINTNLWVDADSGALSSTPGGTVLTLSQAAGTGSRILVDSYGTANGNLSFRQCRNTRTSPQAVQSNDILASITSFGYGTSGYWGSMATIKSYADETWTNTANGTHWGFATTATGGNTTTEKMWIYGSGGVRIGSSSSDPGANNLSVVGTVAGSNLSGTNTGDNATNSQYSSDYRAANFVAGTNYLAPTGSAAGLTSFPTLNQNTTGSAAKLTTARAIYGNNFDGSAALTQIITSTYGGTGNGFFAVSGPASTAKTFTFPNANATIARTDAAQTFTGAQTFSTAIAVGSGGSGTGTAFTLGSVLFATTSGVYSQDNANFFWDATNHRLGIGTTTPNNKIQVTGLIKFVDADLNTFIGYNAGNVVTGGSGIGNSFIGYQAGLVTTTGILNTSVGGNSMFSNTTGGYNSVLGYRAMYANTTGTGNTAFGAYAFSANVSGDNNSAFGRNAAAFLTGGTNSIFGSSTGYDVTSCNGNTMLGYNTGRGITTGSYNTIVGASVTGLSSTLANNIILADGQGNIRAQHDGTSWNNMRQAPRKYTTTSTGTLTPEIDTYDVFLLTAQAAGLTVANHSTSTPIDFETIKIRILDNGTARALSFGTNYVAKAGTALPTTTVASKYLELLFEWNTTLGKWNLMSAVQEP